MARCRNAFALDGNLFVLVSPSLASPRDVKICSRLFARDSIVRPFFFALFVMPPVADPGLAIVSCSQCHPGETAPPSVLCWQPPPTPSPHQARPADARRELETQRCPKLRTIMGARLGTTHVRACAWRRSPPLMGCTDDWPDQGPCNAIHTQIDPHQ